MPVRPTAVILDYGGVLSLHQPEADRRRLERLAGGEAAPFWEAYWALRVPYDRGTLGVAAYWQGVGRAVGRNVSADEIGRLVDADLASWGHLDPRMVRFATGLAGAGVRVALLSNMPRELGAYVRRRFPWLAEFAAITLSCELGSVKPEPEIYLRCLERLGAAPAQALFVDDREPNVEAARRLGLHALLFTSADALAADLEAGFALPVRL